MNIVEIINKKRNKKSLTKEEIFYVIEEYVKNNIPDYQMSALLMAITMGGMNKNETFYLTEAMLNSGEKINLDRIKGKKVDKHSTGGVGDKTTLILLPLVASCGVKAPKMSGRGLGFTGGTIDKIESIPGYNTNINIDKFIAQVNNIGLALASQTGNLVPADKKIYALRDVTGTVSSIPLIASSIMSKKLASGADTIIIDLKVGNGALMKDIESARILAKTMVQIGESYNKTVVCVLTSMEEVLGNAVGNAVEVMESIDVLQNKGPKDITNLVIFLASLMVSLGLSISFDEANIKVIKNLKNGKAYNKFLELIESGNGNLDKMEVSQKIVSIKSKETGFVKSMNTEGLGEIVRKLGGGRYNKNDVIDHKVGLILSKKVGDYVMEDEEILKVYLGEKDIEIDDILDCFEIDMMCGDIAPLIIEIIK
ncbi:MAG: thymidine phosphorylase [Bacilli bacterium]